MNNRVGRRLGKVQIESLVARGGVAEVYLGTHLTLGHKVAVKILRSRSEDNTDALMRFQREARVIAKLRHPNIVQVYDFDTADNEPYLVMEYVEGPSLAKYLSVLHQNNRRLQLPQVVRLINAVASALQSAHNNGVIHRDIKPGNILLRSSSSPIALDKPLPADFEPILTDFGLVRFLDSNRETTMGHIAGTPAYMSPEQARGETTDARTDIYSLGVVLYEILAGHIPFDGETTMSILLKQMNEPPPPIPGLTPMIDQVLSRALAKDLKDRFQTPMELANAFSEAVEVSTNRETIHRDKPPVIVPPLTKGSPFQRRGISIGLLGLTVLAVGAFLFIQGKASPSPPISTATLTSTVGASPSAIYTATVPTATGTNTPLASFPSGPDAILHFENGTALADQATLIARAIPAPPAGTQYEVWLTSSKGRLSLGIFTPDGTGKGKLTFSKPDGTDLLALYDRVEVTIEPKPDTDPKSSGLIAYSFTLPTEELTHLRYLLTSFPNTPNKTALMQGLYTDTEKIDQLVRAMQDAFARDEKATAGQKAEAALNLLVGAQSTDYKDWNKDGVIESAKSYGLLLNGNRFGYIQATLGEADYTANDPEATQFMISNGEAVKTCTQNLTLWAPQLRDLLLKVLTSSSDSEISQVIKDSVVLADQMLNGVDLDKNATVDPISGECGAQVAYEFAYEMADMPLLPTSPSYQLTAVATQFGATPTRSNSSGTGSFQNTQPASQSTQPANNNNNGNNGNNGNGNGNNNPPPKKTKEPNPNANTSSASTDQPNNKNKP